MIQVAPPRHHARYRLTRAVAISALMALTGLVSVAEPVAAEPSCVHEVPFTVYCVAYEPIPYLSAVPVAPVGPDMSFSYAVGTVYLPDYFVYAIGVGVVDPGASEPYAPCQTWVVACEEPHEASGLRHYVEQPVGELEESSQPIECLGMGTFFLVNENAPNQPIILGVGLYPEGGGGPCREGVPL